jgi:ribosomal peptide maturation radical SAM protein 1
MPFGSLSRPALGISLLKAHCTEVGVPCDLRYLNFTFAEFIGHDDYVWVSSALPYIAFAGDWLFTQSLYGQAPERDQRYMNEVLRRAWQLSEIDIARILAIRDRVEHFLDYCMAAIPWQDYALVGFTSTFEQNIASLALAKRIKSLHPHIGIVFGGANWEGEMGCELHQRFPFVDFACSGEAEQSFAALAQQVVLHQHRNLLQPIPGVIAREQGQTVFAGPAELVRDMDAEPIPDYDDYFAVLDQNTAGGAVVPTLLIETSRGCWWGAKSHCTFCGLNGGSMSFRSKSARRALDELEYLVDRWRVDHVEAVDNILDMKYFNDMLPALASSGRQVQMFYEVKANLSRRQVTLLKEAGVYRIQPGIESLSDHVLKLMRKGTTGLRNVQLLKWCKELGVQVDWNILYGFPGETVEDYEQMLHLLRDIRHLQPPAACGGIRLDRFSPYFDAPEQYGFINIRPIQPYAFLYPFEDVQPECDAEASRKRLAYYFEFDYRDDVWPDGQAASAIATAIHSVIAYVEAWKRYPESGTLSSVAHGEGEDAVLVVRDTRSGAVLPELRLTGLEKVAYEFCDEIRTAATVSAHLRKLAPHLPIEGSQVAGLLDSLVANRLMAHDGTHYLSLAVPVPRLNSAQNPCGCSDYAATKTQSLPASSYLLPLVAA